MLAQFLVLLYNCTYELSCETSSKLAVDHSDWIYCFLGLKLLILFCSYSFSYHYLLWKHLLASQLHSNILPWYYGLSTYMLVLPSVMQQQTAVHLI